MRREWSQAGKESEAESQTKRRCTQQAFQEPRVREPRVRVGFWAPLQGTGVRWGLRGQEEPHLSPVFFT